MRTSLPLFLALSLLSACAITQPTQTTPKSAPNPLTACKPFPLTQYHWEEGYPKMLGGLDHQDTFYPLYAGLGALSWVGATPLLPIMDLFAVPVRLYQPCT